MALPLLQSKLFVPPTRPALVPRPRLIERLNEGLQRKLTLISAPAGFGKTTLASVWIRESERPAAWFSLDEGDHALPRFLTYLVAALQRLALTPALSRGEGLGPTIGEGVLTLLHSPQPPSTEALLTMLLNDLAAVPEPFLLVLDDYHVIHAPPVDDALTFLLEHLPPTLHLVLTTRKDPRLPLARLRVRHQVTELRAAELRFTSDEAARFLTQVMGLPLSADEVARLESRTEGWIAGLQLAALSMQGQADHARFIESFTGSQRFVLDYLVEEVLHRQPEELRRFLLQTSILDRLSGPLCDTVTGQQQGQERLEILERSNLFVVPLDDERRWYRYHHLFADMLQARLREAQPDHLPLLHERASVWYEENHEPAGAIAHALAAEAFERAASLMGRAARAMVLRGEQQTFLRWLDALPEETSYAHGALLLYKGWAMFAAGQITEAATCATLAAKRFDEDEAARVEQGRLRTLQAWIALHQEPVETVVEVGSEALDLIGDEDDAFRAMGLMILGQASEIGGEVGAAVNTYRQALSSAERAHTPLTRALAHLHLTLALNDSGQRREARALCQGMLPASREERPSEPLSELLDLASGTLAYEANQLDEAHEQLQSGVKSCEQVGLGGALLYGQHMLAQVHRAQGEWEAALLTAQEVAKRATRQSSTNYQLWAAAFQTELALQRGDLATAEKWSEQVVLSANDTANVWDELVVLARARLSLSRGRAAEALSLLAPLERAAEEGQRRRVLLTILLLQARGQHALGNESQVRNRLMAALKLAAPQEYLRAFLDEGPKLLDLLRTSLPRLDRAEALAFAGRVLAAGRVPTAEPPPLAEPLTEREQEILRLIAAGRSNPEIADLLVLSINTIKWHIKNLYSKLYVSSRVEAAARAQALGLL